MKKKKIKIPEGFRGKLIWDEDAQELVPFIKEKKKSELTVMTYDEQPATKSMATFDSPVFTSRRKQRAYEKSHGFYETGGEHIKAELEEMERVKAGEAPRSHEKPMTAAERDKEAREDKELVEAAAMDVRYGRVKFTEKEKQRFKDEERKWGPSYKVKV